MSAPIEWLGSWGMQRPDVNADGYPIDDWDDDTSTMSGRCHWCQRPATWTRRADGMPGCADHPVNKLGWERREPVIAYRCVRCGQAVRIFNDDTRDEGET